MFLVISITLILIIILIYIYFNMNLLKISKYQVTSKKLPDSFSNYKIVQLTDLHNKRFGKDNIKLIKKVESLNPDIIVMTGDMVEKYYFKIDIILDLVKTLSKKYKVYYSLGNHELYYNYNNLKKLKEEIIERGAILLEDEFTTIKKGNGEIRIYGLNFKHNMVTKTKLNFRRIMNSLLGKVDIEKFNILLAHDALNFRNYVNYGVDLVFSGHVHGGVIRIFGKGLFSPRKELFPKYTLGKYEKEDTCMIASSGLGNSRIGIRLFNLPEIVEITLKKG